MSQQVLSLQMLKFNRWYFLLTIILFVTELLIAKFAHDLIIRPYGGDVLVVILIYCFARSFIQMPVWKLSLLVFAFACLVETLQYFRIVDQLGLQDHTWARIVIGTSFSWMDILSYAIGIMIILFTELFFRKRTPLQVHDA